MKKNESISLKCVAAFNISTYVQQSNRNSGESKREEKTFEKITAEHFENALNNFISKTKPKKKPY